MEASIIIPTFNEEKDIGECLTSLQAQSYKNFDIIVVDDGSTDRTREIVKKFKNVKLINGEHKGPGFSRNFGAKSAKGEILVFVDADMTFDKNYIKNLVKPILDNKREEIIGTTHELELVKNTDNIWSRCWGRERMNLKYLRGQLTNFSSAFRAMRKKDFLEMGGFNSRYGYADDLTFWFEYGKSPVVAKKTICYHKNPETLKQVYGQSKWIGASIDNLFLEVPLIKYLAPLFLVAALPLMVPLFSLKRCLRNKDFSILPWMLVFMTVRYLGSIEGISGKIYLDSNVR